MRATVPLTMRLRITLTVWWIELPIVVLIIGQVVRCVMLGTILQIV